MSGKVKKSQKKSTEDITSSVMKSIESQDVNMKSHWYFAGISTMLVLSTILVVVLGAILLNVLIYDIQAGRDLALHTYYLKNAPDFPWLLLVFTLLAIYSTYRLARHFEFGYKHRTYAVGAIVLGSVLATSMILSVVGTTNEIANSKPFRSFTPFSKFIEDRMVIGEVVELDINEGSITIEELRGVTITIMYDDETAILGDQTIKPGDTIQAVGKPDDNFSVEVIQVNPKKPRIKDIHGRRKNHEIFRDKAVY